MRRCTVGSLLMDVRQADLADFDACATMPATLQSTHVWQLRLAYDPLATQPGDDLGMVLSRTRLPRPVTIGPGSMEPLNQLWQRAADILVVEDDGGIAGYLALTLPPTLPAARIERLVVAPAYRRSGVGRMLLNAAVQWSRAYQCESLVAFCAARNDPAASFYMRWGLRFAGYSEAFFPRAEIALFFQRPL
jgi:ribosomal protein S18 acetylase RimI-like enzyme